MLELGCVAIIVGLVVLTNAGGVLLAGSMLIVCIAVACAALNRSSK